MLAIIILTGCPEKKNIEKLGFIHSVGYELNEADDAEKEGVLIITIDIPQIAPDADDAREVLSTIAHTSKEGRMKLARKTDRALVSGQLRTALFSSDLAKKGIFDTMDTLLRDHAIGLNLKIIVVDGSPKDLLMEDYPMHPRTSRYLYDMVEKEAKIQLTADTSLHLFKRDFHDDGIDPIVPIVKKGKGEIIIDGIALFLGERYVMKVNPVDARIFMMLHGDNVGGDITKEIKLDDEEKESYLFMTFTTLDSKRKIKVKSPTEIDINVEVKGSISEYTGLLNLSDDEVQKEIEKKFAEHIKGVCERLIKEMQENKTDNIGIGQFVRNNSKYEEWQKMNWKEEIYPNAQINVNVKTQLRGFGGLK